MQGSTAKAGGNISVQAGGSDITLAGSRLEGNNVRLEAANNIRLEDAANTRQSDTDDHSRSAGIGVTISLSGQPLSPYFNAAIGTGSSKENGTEWTPSSIQAAGEASLHSGEDTDLRGAAVSGDKVTLQTGGSLRIESRQTNSHYEENNNSVGIGIQIGRVTGSASSGTLQSDYRSVAEQAGIYAGKQGYDLHVGKNTDLKGAVISSDAASDKNKLSTDTLTYSDIQNKADYSARSVGVSYSNGGNTKYNEKGLTPNLGTTASGSADSTTKSAIANGKIEIRSNPNQDISNLSRDTSGSLNKLGKIFDKETVQEQQELANLFGKEVFNAIGDIGLKEGSAEKVALDAFAGGVMSKLGGSSFASGVAGAGITQLVMNELKNIKDPAILQWASVMT